MNLSPSGALCREQERSPKLKKKAESKANIEFMKHVTELTRRVLDALQAFDCNFVQGIVDRKLVDGATEKANPAQTTREAR
jgi:hypothetical protein